MIVQTAGGVNKNVEEIFFVAFTRRRETIWTGLQDLQD
jgi:hypothetical protein